MIDKVPAYDPSHTTCSASVADALKTTPPSTMHTTTIKTISPTNTIQVDRNSPIPTGSKDQTNGHIYAYIAIGIGALTVVILLTMVITAVCVFRLASLMQLSELCP